MTTQRFTRMYGEIDFTPAWYTRRRQLRASKKRQVLLAALMIGGMAVLTVQTWRQRGELRGHLETLRSSLVSTQKKITEVEKLTAERVSLGKMVEIHRELYQPMNYSQVTGTLASLTPTTIALRGLEIQTQKVTTTRKMTAAELEAAQKAAGKKSKVRDTVSTTRTMITVDVAGLAPSDVELANFIGLVASSGVFQNVKMVFSRQGEWDGHQTREFRIKMEVPMDRRYVPRGEEVADADR